MQVVLLLSDHFEVDQPIVVLHAVQVIDRQDIGDRTVDVLPDHSMSHQESGSSSQAQMELNVAPAWRKPQVRETRGFLPAVIKLRDDLWGVSSTPPVWLQMVTES